MTGEKSLLLGFSAALVLCLSGCETYQAGDAKVVTAPGVGGTVYFPQFSLDRPDRFEFTVGGTRTPVFPHKIRYHTIPSASEWVPYTPFDQSVVKVEIVSPAGSVLRSRTIRPTRFRRFGERRYDVFLWTYAEARSLPRMESYILRVTVIEPSLRRGDDAQIIGATLPR